METIEKPTYVDLLKEGWYILYYPNREYKRLVSYLYEWINPKIAESADRHIAVMGFKEDGFWVTFGISLPLAGYFNRPSRAERINNEELEKEIEKIRERAKGYSKLAEETNANVMQMTLFAMRMADQRLRNLEKRLEKN
ncbi:MAG: hypothetical protein PHF67_03145 [Candidatus Nanoarchaeia archaeon]|nr:hypothetical protein [Candidatus Nanoarchaeia archaeon]